MLHHLISHRTEAALISYSTYDGIAFQGPLNSVSSVTMYLAKAMAVATFVQGTLPATASLRVTLASGSTLSAAAGTPLLLSADKKLVAASRLQDSPNRTSPKQKYENSKH